MLLELLLLGGFAHAVRTYDQKKAKKNNIKPPPSLYDDMKKVVQPLIANSQNQSVENKKSKEEKEANRDLIISTTSFGLAIAGVLFYPPLTILSVPGWIYVSVPIFQNSYQSFKEKKVNVHTLVAITVVTCCVYQYYVIGNLGILFYSINKKLLSTKFYRSI